MTSSIVSRRPVRPGIVLAICCLSLLMTSMDATAVNVALPSIRRDLSASLAGLQWTIDAYTLVIACFLILAGSMADRWGRRRVFQAGMALFSVGSLLCSLAPGTGWLVLFRMLQAIGGTMLNPVAMSIVTNVFNDPARRARAIGIWAAVPGLSMALGPLAGGLLTETVGWRSIFWINVPIGVATIVLAALFVPESRAARARRFDPVGQLLVIVLLGALIGGVIESRRPGAAAAITGLFVLAGVAAVALLAWELRRADPLIDPRFFRSIPFGSAIATALCAFASFGGFLFLNTFYLQDVRGLSAARTGLWLLPLALGTMVCSPLSGRLVGAYGARPSLLAAGTALTASALLLTGLGPQTGSLRLVLAYLTFGVGFGLVNPPITNTAISGMPRQQAGTAAAIVSSARQTGVSFGVAIAGVLVAGSGAGSGFTGAARLFWWLACASGMVILALGLAGTSRWGIATQRHTAHLLEERSG